MTHPVDTGQGAVNKAFDPENDPRAEVQVQLEPIFRLAEEELNKIKTELDPSSSDQTSIDVDLPEGITQKATRAKNTLGNALVTCRSNLYSTALRNRRNLKFLLIATTVLFFNAHLALTVNHTLAYSLDIDWCSGLGFLIILTAITYWSLFYYLVLKRFFGKRIQTRILAPVRAFYRKILSSSKYVRVALVCLAMLGIAAYLALDAWEQPQRLISGLGVVTLVVFGFLISKYPSDVNWSQVTWGLGLQFVLGLAVLRWETGRGILNCFAGKVTTFLDFATAGSDFVYGYLSSGKPTEGLSFDPIFAFRPLSVTFFFGFCISILYYYGYMQWFIAKLGWILQSTVGTTAVESINASASIFLGMTEAPLLIRPFLSRMTESEIHTIMSNGFATVAGAAFAAYITLGVSASYIISATVMAAFCSLGYSKLIYPEIEKSQTKMKNVFDIETKAEGTVLDAAAHGAIQAGTLIGCVIANIVAFVAFVTFLNAVIGWFGSVAGIQNLSFEYILGKVFIPLAWVMGVDWEECESVAILLGLKTVANEFIAYERLVQMTLSPRSRAIASFALCSFANFGSVGISLGGLSALVPERRTVFSDVVGRAFLSGTIVGFLNGCMAGLLISEPGYSEWIGMNGTISVT